MRLIYIILIFLIGHTVNAQDWLITTSADTLKGEISIELPMERYEEITLKNDDGKQRFKAYQVVEFERDGQKYKTVKRASVYQVMLVESEGYLSHFRYRENQGYEFSSPFLVKSDGGSMEVSSLTFKKSLSDFLEDCQVVVDGLANKKYKRSDLDQIIDDYNNCIDEKSSYTASDDTPEVLDNPAIAIIERILNQNSSNDDLTAMLIDIKSKLSKGQTVPDYLKSALKEQTATLEEIKSDVEELLELLK